MRISRMFAAMAVSAAVVGGGSVGLAWADPPAEHPGNGHAHGKPAADTTVPQPASNADFTGNGANTHGPYDSTRDGSPSGNGNGTGEALGKPCAGCVGKADNKNPKGQLPGPQDANAGYECDTNHGIGRSNPAHTGCKTATTPPTTPPSTPPSTPPTTPPTTTPPTTSTSPATVPTTPSPQSRPNPAAAQSDELAHTGFDVAVPLGAGLLLVAAGGGLLVTTRRRAG